MFAQFTVRGRVALLALALAFAGSWVAGANAQTQTAVEYYYADWNFYFVTSFPEEIAALDAGAFGGVWKRTGQTFDVWTGPTNGALPACRFFSTIFSPRSSHFYTPYANECASLKAGAGWQFEAIAFYVLLPDDSGNCPAGTDVLYRLYNQGMGGAPNHRFVRSNTLFSQMRAAGWVFEGNGLTGAYACVPSSPPAPPTAEGGWSGSSSDGGSIVGVVLDTGDYYLLYYYLPSNQLGGFLQGTGSSAGGLFSSQDGFDYRFRGGRLPTTLNGSYAAKSTFSATSSATGVAFTTTYVHLYDSPLTLDTYAGTYSTNVADSITLDAQGGVWGHTAGSICTFNGTAAPHGGVAVLNVTLAFSGGVGCSIAGFTLKGVAFFYDAAHTLLIVMLTSPDHAFFTYVFSRSAP